MHSFPTQEKSHVVHASREYQRSNARLTSWGFSTGSCPINAVRTRLISTWTAKLPVVGRKWSSGGKLGNFETLRPSLDRGNEISERSLCLQESGNIRG